MATYQHAGFRFNASADDVASMPGLGRYLAARQREVNTIETEVLICSGGPFDGQTIELTQELAGKSATAAMTVGKWVGCYERWTETKDGKEFACANWRGTDQLDTARVYRDTPQGGKTATKPASPALGKGFALLADFLAALSEEPELTTMYGVEFAVYRIGRTMYRINNTPEAVDRLRALVLKKKKWFGDKLFNAAGPARSADIAQSAPETPAAQTPRAQAAINAVATIAPTADVLAIAVAAIEAASESSRPQELAEVGAVALQTVTSMQAGQPPAPAIGMTGHATSAAGTPAGQTVHSKSGNWTARLYRADNGRAALHFDSVDRMPVDLEFEDSKDRMKWLQDMAREADHAPTTGQPPAMGCVSVPIQPLGGCVSVQNQNAPGCVSVQPGKLAITLTRAEGMEDECGQPVTVASFNAANAVLHAWSETAPKSGGYDKCDFSIVWPDGGDYEGRYDLKHHSIEPASLTAHMVDQAEYMTGQHCPIHMGGKQYAEHMARIDTATHALFIQVLAVMQLGAHHPKTHPVSVNLMALIAHGLPVADLIGSGVVMYSPDSHSQIRTGAIVSAEAHKRGITLLMRFEDGEERQADGGTFTDHDSSHAARYRLDLRRHGAPYLAQLTAAVASLKARNSSAQLMATQAKARAVAHIRNAYPQLIEASQGGKLSGATLAAANLRILLKAAFKGMKFSVKTSSYSSGNSIDVTWTDGPTDGQVSEIVGLFQKGNFDGMTDSYTDGNNPFNDLFGGTYYAHTRRTLSDAAIGALIAKIWPDATNRPAVQDYQSGKNRAIFQDEDYRDRVYMASIHWTPAG